MSSTSGYQQFQDKWEANALLALDTIAMEPTKGIPTWIINVMEWAQLDRFTGNPPGSYERDPVRVYLEFKLRAGVSFIDQWIPTNPLSMKDQGYDADTKREATTGAEEVVRDGMLIDSPETVVEHMEKFLFPMWKQQKVDHEQNVDDHVAKLIEKEVRLQQLFGMNIVKGPYDGFQSMPYLLYGHYGYANYFMAYALYPDVMERSFELQADAAEVINRLAARAIIEGGLPRLIRLDHDMADSRGTLVDERSLDKIWFPHFARCIKPLLDAGVRLIWHCDGNLMGMVPRLLEAGLGGFQGFQYEAGMDYEKICRLKDRNGNPLFIIGGVSVTRTLPYGTPEDVRREMKWLVDNGPKVGLVLGCSSSVTPGVPTENLQALLDGFAYYREHGRS